MEVDELAFAVKKISLLELHRPRTIPPPTLDDEPDDMSIAEVDSSEEPAPSVASSEDSSQPTQQLETERQYSETSSRSPSPALQLPARKPAWDRPRPMRPSSPSAPRLVAEVALLLLWLYAEFSDRQKYLSYEQGQLKICLFVLAAVFQLLGLVELLLRLVRSMFKMGADWSPLIKGSVREPKYWWWTRTERSIPEMLMATVLIAFRATILAACIAVLGMDFNEEWAMTVREMMRLVEDDKKTWIRWFWDCLVWVWPRDRHDSLTRLFLEGANECPVADWASIQFPFCASEFR